MDNDEFRLAVHGLAVQLSCDVPAIGETLSHYLGEFAVPAWPDGFAPATGVIRSYEQREVLRCISPAAQRIGESRELLEIYQDEERFWVIDERFGMIEINLLKSTWRTWLLPGASNDPVRAAHFAALWPMSQVLRGKGLHLLAASAISRGGTSLLVLCPFGIEPELSTLARAGWRIIGQSWTAARVENNRIELLRVPGLVQQQRAVAPPPPRHRALGLSSGGGADWIDLTREHEQAEQRYGFCNGVIIVEPVRRPAASLARVDSSQAIHELRAAWPIEELHPSRRPSLMAAQLAQRCACFQAALSRDPNEFARLIANTFTAAHRPLPRAAAVA